MTNTKFVWFCPNFAQFSKILKISKQSKFEVSNSINKKFGTTMQFPECLENIPFKGSFEFEILSSTYTDKNISDKSY